MKSLMVTFFYLTGMRVCYRGVTITFCWCWLWVSRIVTWHLWVIGWVFGFVRKGFWASFTGIEFNGSIFSIFIFIWNVWGLFRVIIGDGPFETLSHWFRSSSYVSHSITYYYPDLVSSSSSLTIHYPSSPNFLNLSTTSWHSVVFKVRFFTSKGFISVVSLEAIIYS